MEELLTEIDSDACRNCGGVIVQLQGEWSAPHWVHKASSSPRGMEETCPGVPRAEPVGVEPSGVRQMSRDALIVSLTQQFDGPTQLIEAYVDLMLTNAANAGDRIRLERKLAEATGA